MRHPKIYTVKQLGHRHGDTRGPVLRGAEESEKAFSGRDVAASASAQPVEQLTVVRDTRRQRRFAATVIARPYFACGEKAFVERQCHGLCK